MAGDGATICRYAGLKQPRGEEEEEKEERRKKKSRKKRRRTRRWVRKREKGEKRTAAKHCSDGEVTAPERTQTAARERAPRRTYARCVAA